MQRILSLLLTVVSILVLMLPANAWADSPIADTPIATAQLFEIHCAGCHPNGGNIIRRGKTLKQNALKRNKIDSLEAIAALVTEGKNNMSAFKDRLSADEIQAISAYVLEQAERNWKS